MTLPEIFFNPKQARKMANHSSKKKKTGIKRKGEKKNSKVEKPKTVGHFLVSKFWFLRMRGSKCLKRDSSDKNG